MNLYYRLKQLNVDSFNDKVIERYHQLRHSYLATESLIKRYQDYYELLKNTGAAQREEEKWSGDSDVDGETINFEEEITYIINWITQHMIYLDNYVFNKTTNISHSLITSTERDYFYNLSGQRVNKPQKNIYITRQKKLLNYRRK